MKLNEIEITLEGVNDPHIFKAIFMGGSPGAGKSTVAKMLFSHTGLKQVNVDKFFELHQKLGKEIDYKKFHRLATSQRDNYLIGRLGLLIDGTARRIDRLMQVSDTLKSLGYDVGMVFVNTDLRTALKRAEVRGHNTGRILDPEMIKNYWRATQANLGELQGMFGSNFWLVDNSGESPNLKYSEKEIRRWLEKPPSNFIAKQWIAQNKSGK